MQKLVEPVGRFVLFKIIIYFSIENRLSHIFLMAVKVQKIVKKMTDD